MKYGKRVHILRGLKQRVAAGVRASGAFISQQGKGVILRQKKGEGSLAGSREEDEEMDGQT